MAGKEGWILLGVIVAVIFLASRKRKSGGQPLEPSDGNSSPSENPQKDEEAAISPGAPVTDNKGISGVEKPSLDSPKKEPPDKGEKSLDSENGEPPKNSPSVSKEGNPDSTPPPAGRGGAPRPEPKNPPEGKETIEPHHPCPELVCFEKNGIWETGIKFPPELDGTNPLVFIGDKPVKRNEENDDDELFYSLPQITGEAVVQWDDDKKTIPLLSESAPYLIFKPRARWEGQGRLIKNPTKGCCVILAGNECARIGAPPIELAASKYPNIRAHYFNFSPDGEKDGFRCGGKEFPLSSDSRFSLEGEKTDDDSRMGSIFLGNAPRLQDKQDWEGVGVVVVGEEGKGKKKWRDSFYPATDNKSLDDLLREKSGGWYFARIYDIKNELLDSMDFRFMRKLTAINVFADLLPGNDGHRPAKIEFIGDCKIAPQSGDSLICRKESGKITAEIPPHPSVDKTKWRITDGDATIAAEIVIPRLWWTLESKDQSPPQSWTDKPIELSRNDFTATSKKGIWIKLPRPGFVKEVRAGFSALKSHEVTAKQECLCIPLREFEGYPEIQQERGACEWKTVIDHSGKTAEAAVIKILPVPQPPPLSPPSETGKAPPEIKRPVIRCRCCKRGWRTGKGFSRLELTEAGLTFSAARTRGFRIDKKRGTRHCDNMSHLKKQNAQ